MRIRRDISSIPLRSGSETWARFVELVSGVDSNDAEHLAAAGGVIASIIADEIPADRPFLLEGVGPQLRIYCRYGAEAIQEGDDVDPLTWNPTAGDWTLYVPCDGENIGWVGNALSKISRRLKVFDVAESGAREDLDPLSYRLSSRIVLRDRHSASGPIQDRQTLASPQRRLPDLCLRVVGEK